MSRASLRERCHATGLRSPSDLPIKDEPLVGLNWREAPIEAGHPVPGSGNLGDSALLPLLRNPQVAILESRLTSGNNVQVMRQARRRDMPRLIRSGYQQEDVLASGYVGVLRRAKRAHAADRPGMLGRMSNRRW